MLKMLVREGNKLVARDENKNVVTEKGKAVAVVLPKPDAPQETWRKSIARLTRNGRDMQDVLYNLAMGNAYEVKLPDGRVSEPIIPTAEVRRACAVTLHEWLHGKAVAQTEVMAAEKEAEDVQQYRALSDAELAAAAIPYLERIQQTRRELARGDSESEKSDE